MSEKIDPQIRNRAHPSCAEAPPRKLTALAGGVVLFLTLLSAQLHAHVVLDFPNGGEMLEAGSVVQIVWHDSVNHGPATYDLSYSMSGPGGPWEVIEDGVSPSGGANTTFDWVVPDTPSDQVRIQVLQDNSQGQDYSDMSDTDLAIVKSSPVLQVVLDPLKDATIFEDGNGTNANGSGEYLFTGKTESQNDSAERRALLAFAIAESIPAGSTITEVNLELTVSRTRSGSQPVGIHRLLEDWSEGPTDPPGQEGGGATATTGDVTWIHREYSGTLWSTAGASFASAASSTLQVADEGEYSFPSTPEMVADVQGWLNDPAGNFGWALVVDSPPVGSAKRFNSRENGSAATRPKLVISYQADLEGPTADFSFDPIHPQPGQEVQFSDQSSGGPTNWLWDFGDGQTSDEANPTHTYVSGGFKTVTLVVSNASGSDTVVKVVRLLTPPRRPSRRATFSP